MQIGLPLAVVFRQAQAFGQALLNMPQGLQAGVEQAVLQALQVAGLGGQGVGAFLVVVLQLLLHGAQVVGGAQQPGQQVLQLAVPFVGQLHIAIHHQGVGPDFAVLHQRVQALQAGGHFCDGALALCGGFLGLGVADPQRLGVALQGLQRLLLAGRLRRVQGHFLLQGGKAQAQRFNGFGQGLGAAVGGKGQGFQGMHLPCPGGGTGQAGAAF